MDAVVHFIPHKVIVKVDIQSGCNGVGVFIQHNPLCIVVFVKPSIDHIVCLQVSGHIVKCICIVVSGIFIDYILCLLIIYRLPIIILTIIAIVIISLVVLVHCVLLII